MLVQSPRFCRSIAIALISLPLVSCAPPLPSKPDANAVNPHATISPLGRELGELEIFVTDQVTDGRNLMLRGTIRNPYPEATEGVRVVFIIVSESGRELDRAQRELGVKLAPGARTALRLDLQSMYFGQSGGSRFTIVAFAKARGGQPLDPPPDWKD